MPASNTTTTPPPSAPCSTTSARNIPSSRSRDTRSPASSGGRVTRTARSPAHNARYEENLVNLIKAWRKEFNAPNAPWAIATVGFHGENMPENYVKIAEAQLNVADPKRHPELAGTVKTIDTRPFWRDASISPKNQDYHYNHNAETYMLVGDALGRAMVGDERRQGGISPARHDQTRFRAAQAASRPPPRS